MKFQSLIAFSLLLSATVSRSMAGIVFGPVRGQAGESVRLVTHSETPGGVIERTVGGKASRGTISIIRDRELVWTFRQAADDGTKRGMVRVPKISMSTLISIDGKQEKNEENSPLTGKMFAMSKSPAGEWKFDLDGSVPLERVRQEIEELTVYLKRNWYPSHEINLGDSWEFDPAWVKFIIQKDLASAQTIGTMRLRQVRRAEGRQVAIMDVSIQSSGTDYKSDGSEASASVALTGIVTVNLDTMLDEELKLAGTITTSSRKASETKKVTLPVRLSVKKSFVRDRFAP